MSADGPTEFGYYKSGFDGLAESPSCRIAPLSGQSHVGALNFQDVARDFDAHTLARE
jgi:hypothetical protein